MLNKTPPIGAPNVAETPAAAAAPNKSRRSIAFFLNTFNPEIGKSNNMTAKEAPIQTNGPSDPMFNVEPLAKIKPNTFAINIRQPKKSC